MKITCSKCNLSDQIEILPTMKLESFNLNFQPQYYTITCKRCRIFTECDDITKVKIIGKVKEIE